MKYLLLATFALLFCVHAVSAQSLTENKVVPEPGMKLNISDPASLNVYPMTIIPNKNNSDRIMGDTLSTYFERSTGFSCYSFTSQGNTIILTGRNNYYYFIGSRYNNSKSLVIDEVLIAFFLKAFLGSNLDTIGVMVYNNDATYNLPTGTPIGMAYPNLDDFDTSTTNLVFSPIKMAVPANINSNFSIMMLTNNGTNEYDAVALTTNVQGNGNNEKSIVVIVPNQQQQLVGTTLTDYFAQLQMPDGNPPNIDLMFIPIASGSPNDVNDNSIQFEGISIKNVGANPATDYADFLVNIEKSTNLTLNIVNIRGQVVKSIERKDLQSGAYNFDFDLKDVPSGAYYYVVITDFTKFGGKFTIVK